MSDTRAVSRLASARLVVPMPSRRLVRRARVTRLLDREVGDHPVTVVTAGPGTGKTFAVADWVREGHPPGPVAWLSLDPVVRTPVRFWSSVLGALTATLGEGALGALRTPAVVDEDFVEVLAERLGGVGVVLVLDDVHELPPEVVDGVDQLLRVPPAGLHVVLISRHDPPLSLHRHRLAGRLGEVRAHDLAFDAGEVHELLREEGVDLDDIGVQRLLTISQGWAAGLRLAVLSLSRAADPAQALQRFGGQQPLVASYLGEELLGGLSAERATFLLRTCVPDRICGPLATVLTGDPAAPGLLASVFTDDLMVVELEGSGWFRYHPLLQQLLRHRLHRDHPSLEAELHGRASAWFERSGEWLTALDHAVRGGDLDRVAQVALRSASVMVFSGDRAPLATAIAALDPASATHRPDLLVVLAVGAFCGGQHDLTASLLARAEAGLGALPPDRERLATLNLRVLQALEARRLGDETALRSCAEAAVRLCEELAPEEAPGWARFRGAAVAVVAVGRLWSGRPQAALEALRQARTFDPGARHPGYPEVYYAGYLGLALLLRGEVAEARAAATRALGQAEAMGTQRSHETGPAWLTLALAELQGGREDAALAAAADGLSGGDRLDPFVATVLRLTRVWAHALAGDGAAAKRELGAADRLIEAHPGLVYAAALRTAAAVELALRAGRVDRAQALLHARAGVAGVDSEHDPLAVARARVLLASGHPEQVRAALGPALERSAGAGATAWVLVALAEDRMRHDARAVEALARALDLAAPGELVLPFRIASARWRTVLTRHLEVVGSHRDFVRRLVTVVTTHEPAAPSAPSAPTDPLTERELAVLAYLPTMRSNTEIAQELTVSVNTVKQHLKSIHRKLGVSTRREAVRAARDLDLLPYADGAGEAQAGR